jgi:hypothetical protein
VPLRSDGFETMTMNRAPPEEVVRQNGGVELRRTCCFVDLKLPSLPCMVLVMDTSCKRTAGVQTRRDFVMLPTTTVEAQSAVKSCRSHKD